MNPRIILQRLIAQLAPEVGQITEADYAAWEGEDAELPAGAASGRFHLASALIEARAALASGDEARIQSAALICPTFERTGREMALLHQRRAAGRAPKRRTWADVLAEHVSRWEEIPEAPGIEIEGNDRDLRFYRDGKKVCCIDANTGQEIGELARSTFKKRYLR